MAEKGEFAMHRKITEFFSYFPNNFPATLADTYIKAFGSFVFP